MNHLSYALGLLLLLTACARPTEHVAMGPHGPVTVTTRETTTYRRARTEKQLVLPLDVQRQLTRYRHQHGFFPLTLSGLAAESDSARAAVAALARAGFTQAELVGGGNPDSVRLVFQFSTTGGYVQALTTQSADLISVSQATQHAEPAVADGWIPGAFRFQAQPDGRVTYTRHLGSYVGRARWLSRLGL